MAWWAKVLDIISAPLSQPSTLIKEGWGAAAKKVETTRKEIALGQASGLKVIGTTLATTAILGGAVLGGAAIVAAPKAAAVTVAKFIIPKTLKGKIIGGTATLLGAGILAESPKARKVVAETAVGVPEKVGGILEFGGEIGKVIEEEKTFGKEEIITGLKVAGVVGAAAAVATVVVPKIIKKVKEMREEKAIESDQVEKIVAPEPAEQLVAEKPVGVLTEAPSPETTTITTGKKPYKRRRAKITPSVRQSVRVNVIANPRATGMRIINKRYINQEILA